METCTKARSSFSQRGEGKLLNITFNEEETKAMAAVETARKTLEKERNGAAETAYKKALADVGYDRSRLIVHTMPNGFGGAVIHKVPSFETWTMFSKRALKAISTDGKKDDYHVAMTQLVEQPALLVYPAIDELQKWRDELPGLYGKIHDTMEARCNEGNYAGK